MTGPTTYGDRGQVTTIGGTTFVYFGAGNHRVWRDGTTDFLLSPLGPTRLVQGGVTTRTVRTPDGKVLGAKVGAVHQYYATDNQGTVIGQYDHTGTWKGGATYTPYGEQRHTAAGFTAKYRYTGQVYAGAINLYKLGARYYDTNTARFIQMDPTGQENNPYTYAAANPCNNTDTSGTSALSCVGDGLSLVGGAISFIAGVLGAVPSAMGTLGLVGGGIGLIGAGLSAVDSCLS